MKKKTRKGKGFKEGALKFLRKEVLPTAIDFGSEQLKKAVSGEGMKKSKTSGGSGSSCEGGALMPAGYGLKKRGEDI